MVQTLRLDDEIFIESHPIPDYIYESKRIFALSFSRISYRIIIGVAIEYGSYCMYNFYFKIIFM
jgi:hypothetical protein